MEQIQYKNQVINYSIIRKNIKNIYIKIQNGAVMITAPQYVPDKQIEELINKKQKWIYNKLKESDKKDIRKDLYSEDEFVKIVSEIVNELISITGLKPNKIRVRDIKYAWGTCSAKKNITINAKLIQYPKEAIRYVILHELCHIRHMNHSKKFWNLVEYYMPDYKEVKRKLKG